jgi:hypothetical protein
MHPVECQQQRCAGLYRLIEDYFGESWNQGDAERLESCEAIWNGTDLEIWPTIACSNPLIVQVNVLKH